MFPNGYNMPLYSTYNVPGMAIRMSQLPRSGGLFSRLGGNLGTIKSFNWQGLLTNASKTLGVINQAIPVVKQVGPIYNNMKSMLKVASLFKDETDPKPKSNNKIQTSNKTMINKEEKEKTIINNDYSNNPNFFI